MIPLFLASFVYVGLKAAQQLNVQHAYYIAMVPTSYGMAACEAFTIWKIATDFSVPNIAAVGTGAWMGCWIAVWVHGRARHAKTVS